MNGKRSTGAALLPLVAFISTLGQDQPEALKYRQRPGDKEATLPDLRLEPVALRVAQGKLYGLVPLVDGRILAFDRSNHRPVYLMTKVQPANGTYFLTSSGSLTVRNGVVTDVTSKAQSSAHTLSFDRRGNLIVTWRVRLPRGAAIGTDPDGRDHRAISVIDLKDRSLMLVEGKHIYRLRLRLAPDGEYRSPAIGSLLVRAGTLDPISGDPDYMLADDYAP
jgi:hypothetical protein